MLALVGGLSIILGFKARLGAVLIILFLVPVTFMMHKFWDITDPKLAVLVHSVAGGTPAYRRELLREDTPADLADFDPWVIRTVLNPQTPLFREARYLLAEETGAHERHFLGGAVIEPVHDVDHNDDHD